MLKPRIKIPDGIKAGDIIEIKTLISHMMETGQRKDKAGKTIPRNIINTLIARYNGKEFFKAELQPGVSANPYLAFFLRAQAPGELELTWWDDAGEMVVEKIELNVS
jgi:sulfur-oxidizing protein SoxZ